MKLLMCRQSGFSLFEVLIVVALVSLTVSVSMFYWCSSKSSLVYSELERLSAFFTLVHHKAQADGCAYTISFDIKSGRYSTPFCSEKLMEGVEFSVLPSIKGPPATPLQIIKKPITFVGEKVLFDAQGIIQPGTVYLTDTARSCLYALSIAVGQMSYIRKYKYTDSWALL